MTTVPDYYLPSLANALSYLTDEEMAWVLDPTEGIATRCKFPPVSADVHELLREKRAKRDKFKPAPTHYRYLREELDKRGLQTLGKRKEFLISELGYDPAKVRGLSEPKWCFDPEKPPKDAPWRDPEALRESARRIAQEMAKLAEEQAA